MDTHYCKTSIWNSDSVFNWCPLKFPTDQTHFISGLNFFYCCGPVKTLHGYHTECMAMQVERMICIKCLACSTTMFKTLINVPSCYDMIYCICSRNLRTFFPILAAEKSGCVKYADFFCGGLDLGFILV